MLEETFGLKGKVCLVTGGGRGIGRAAAHALAEAGADIALAARTSGEIEQVAGEIRGRGRRALPLIADMTDLQRLPRLVAETVAGLGRLDVLVNNAGIALRGSLESASIEDFDYQVDVNLKAGLVLAQAAIPHMRAQGGGKVINVTSMTAEIGQVGSGVYGMTKGGIKLLTKALAVELALQGDNIQVNCIGPGAIATPQYKEIMRREPHHEPHVLAKIPMGRAAEPEELGGTFVFLASKASDYMTGQTVYVDGGWLSY